MSRPRPAPPELLAASGSAPPGRSPWRDARKRFLRNRAAVASVIVLLLITLACVLGPMLLPHAYDEVDWNLMGIAPTLTAWHLFGTDEQGRDLLVRTLVGGRVSLTVGLSATLLSVSLGVVLMLNAVRAVFGLRGI